MASKHPLSERIYTTYEYLVRQGVGPAAAQRVIIQRFGLTPTEAMRVAAHFARTPDDDEIEVTV